jgi:ribosomal protein RSM22 (predicted rRNA methylase)
VVFVAAKTEKTKEQKIKSEIARLKSVLRDLDKNKLKAVTSLIQTAAFMAVSLEELQETINAEGYTEEYQNGANQYGTKQSEAVKTHLAMTKNYTAVIKVLADLAPPAKAAESRLSVLRRSA